MKNCLLMLFVFGLIYPLISFAVDVVDFTENSLVKVTPEEPLEQLTFDEANRVREENGLQPLIRDSKLDDAARQHSYEMANEDYVGHFSPHIELYGPYNRIYNAGVTDTKIAENVLMTNDIGEDEETAIYFIELWMDSPPHKEALMTGDYNHGGMGIYRAENGSVYATHLFSD